MLASGTVQERAEANVSIPSSFPCQSPNDPTIFDFGGLVSAPRYDKAALGIERPSRPWERSDKRKPYQIISNGTSGAGGRGIPRQRKEVSVSPESRSRGPPSVEGYQHWEGWADPYRPRSVSSLLMRLRAMTKMRGCDGGKRGRLERTEKDGQRGRGEHLISQAFPRTVTSLCGKEEEKEEERGGKWAGGCLMGITNTRHTMTHPASAYFWRGPS